MRIFTPLFVAVLVGCGASGPPSTESSSADLRHRDDSTNPNPMLFPKDARPYGRPMSRWAELMWSYIYGTPIDRNPFFETTGKFCAVNQDGPVWFLPAVPGSTLDGVNIQDPLSYRFFSPDVFSFNADLSLVAFDSCVTQRHMLGVVDGFYLLFKPMTPGKHTIVLIGHDMEGVPVTLTENLSIVEE